MHTFQPWTVEKRCLPPRLVTEDDKIVVYLTNFYHNSTPLDVNMILQDPLLFMIQLTLLQEIYIVMLISGVL